MTKRIRNINKKIKKLSFRGSDFAFFHDFCRSKRYIQDKICGNFLFDYQSLYMYMYVDDFKNNLIIVPFYSSQ